MVNLASFVTLTVFLTFATDKVGAGGYLIAVPKVIIRNSVARVCTTFHDIKDDVTIDFTLRCVRRKTTSNQRETFPNGIDKCIDLQVPEFINKAKANISARVTLSSSSPAQSPPEYHQEVMVAARDYMIIIQTDKPFYKPGQKVRIRILVLTLDLRPKEGSISLVYLKDSEGYRLIEWKDVPTRVGLAQLEYPLAELTATGQWKLVVEAEAGYHEMKMFRVGHYVLPRFEAYLEAPGFLPADGSSFNVRVCAKYIYGKQVSGNYTVVYCHFSTCSTIHGQLHECATVSVDWCPAMVRKPTDDTRISIYVNVTDLHTGVTMTSGKQRVESNGRVKVDLQSYSPPYFKPGIPYSGKAVLRFRSGEPAEGAKLVLTVRHEGDPPDGAMRQRHEVRYSADHKGEVLFTLPKLSKLVDNFTLKAQASTNYAMKPRMKSPEAITFKVHRWYSPSNSYLQMESQHNLGTCISSLTINTTLLLRPSLKSTIRLHYQLSTDRGMLDTGVKDYRIQRPASSVRRPISRVKEHIYSGMEIKRRSYRDSWWNMAIIPNPRRKISRYGRVVQWNMFNRKSQQETKRIYLQVWRKANNSPLSLTYTLVGETRIAYEDWGRHKRTLLGEDRIIVAKGDVIGFYFPEANPVPFSIINRTRGAIKTLYLRNPSRREVGREAMFQQIVHDSWIPYRDYSISAKIEIDDTLAYMTNEAARPRYMMLDVLSSRPLPPVTHLMLYFVTDSGEVVADVLRLDTSPCYRHKVSFTATTTSGGAMVYPGDNVTMEIRADPGSLCAVGVVDRSIHLMEEPSLLSIDKMYKQISKRIPEVAKVKDRHCETNLLDAQKAFQMAGLAVMTNLKVKTRPCDVESDTGWPYAGRQAIDEEVPPSLMPSTTPWTYPAGDAEQGRRIYPGMPTLNHRFYFPETWLWDTAIVEERGHTNRAVSRTVFTRTVPHTITEWTASTMCLSPTSGLGVAPMAHVKVFQPFFISFILPATVIVKEIIPLKVTINSYLDECFELALRMEPVSGLALEEGGVEEVICICEQNTVSLPYKVAPVEKGLINVTFSAQVVQKPRVCKFTDAHVVAMDKVTKTLLVLSEGIEQEDTQTIVECVNGFAEEKIVYMNLTIPVNFVEDSQEAYITVTADVMGPTLNGMHKLLRTPTGCGDQNLAKLATNVHILSYLSNTSQLNKRRQKRALNFISEGYQKVLRYRHRDGSYSPFASDLVPSVWMTAFAVRTFAAARVHTFVEEDTFQTSVRWLQSQQTEAGCFVPSGMVHSRLMFGPGGINNTGRPSVALSSYIMAALLHAGISKHNPIIYKVVQCLSINQTTDTYARVLMTYAFSIYDPNHQKRHHNLEVLFSSAIRSEGFTYWKVSNIAVLPGAQADPADIEVTAYVLLAILASGSHKELHHAAPIVRWLTSQRNSLGGFVSTQDTAIAVEALGLYAARTHRRNTNLVTTVTTPMPAETLQIAIKPENRLLAHRHRVTLPSGIMFVITGTGCALIQGVARYNVPVMVKPVKYFTLDVELHKIPNIVTPADAFTCPKHDCLSRKLQICTRYTGPTSTSQMVTIDIKMVTGWKPVDLNFTDTVVVHHMYKEQNTTMHIYLNSLNRHHECINFTVYQEYEVVEPKAAYVQIYEMHTTPEVGRVQTYTIEEVCKREERDAICRSHLPPAN